MPPNIPAAPGNATGRIAFEIIGGNGEYPGMYDLEAQLREHLHRQPALGAEVYVGAGAVLIGHVTIGDHSSVWPNVVLRADINAVTIGHHTNLQDGAIAHVADPYPCVVGNYVTVGHRALLHACVIGDEVLVGMGSTVMDGAVVGDQCIIGAGALVTMGTQIPAGSLVMGAPARVVRPLKDEERASLRRMADKYTRLAAHYLAMRSSQKV